uniref:Ig-like domain-containing protein n=1 Tax=Tetraodon nigroviridis TaxID=99883 RepID=H3CGF4_TETNG
EFQNNHRFSVNFIQDSYRLTITNLSISDSGTYYCLGSSLYVFQFDKIYIVHVTSLHLNASVDVHRSPSQSNQSGDSVTLNCTVHTGTCDEEHIVYWFRTSGESEPELIYAHEARNDHCENKNNTCFYNLSMNMAKPGIYYCAVAACGRILFGGGNKLDAEDKVSSADHLVYFLTGALVFSTILCILLVLSLIIKLRRRSSSQCTDIQTDPSCEITEMVQENNVHYAALKNHKVNKSRRKKKSTESECVYSFV